MQQHAATANWFHGGRRLFRWKTLASLLGRSIGAWDDDDVPRLSAALAFYALLSLAPILVIVVGVASLFFGDAAARGQLAWEMHRMVGWNEAKMVQSLIESTRNHHSGILATSLSVLALAFGGTSVVVELRSGLNTIWHITPGNASRMKTLVAMAKERFVSVLMILGVGFLLLLSLVASTVVAALGRAVGPNLPFPAAWLHVLTFVISFLVITLLFGAVYKVMPDVELQWRDVMVGASVTSLIFTIGKQLLALYLGKAAFASTYGAAGSFVILLVWVYYSAQLFFLGAEFTKLYAATYGSHPQPAAATRPLTSPEASPGNDPGPNPIETDRPS